MEALTSSAALAVPREPANYDEIAMHQSLLFSDTAEYFELSYTNDDQKQLVADTLKDYAIKALVNTVDHLGAVSSKVNDLLGEKVDEVSQTEHRVSCIRQRLSICQGCFDHEGLAQQSSLINIPMYHKRYILPVGETMQGGIRTKSKYNGCNLEDEDDWHEFKNGNDFFLLLKTFGLYNMIKPVLNFRYPAVRATLRESTPPSSFRKGRSQSASPRASQQPGSFAFTGAVTRKDLVPKCKSRHPFPDKCMTDFIWMMNQRRDRFHHADSLCCVWDLSLAGQPPQIQEQIQASMRVHSDRDKYKEIDLNQIPSKSKRLLKALLSKRKSKKDETLYSYLDEY
ncbi:hypothetical protein E3N88_38930 [Mikania micrantha]|uniref:Protein ABIL2 n=1 Tax=Mikania micrantha TaxID=192012 RepID=A0A5N6LVB9_9ASTR|nr:hypothetical protein E3N88_38930 [Mikania micrantha]